MFCQFMDGWCAEPVFLITDRSVPPESIIKIRQKGLHGDPKHYGSLWIINPRDGGLATFYREYLTDIVDPAFESQRTQYHPDLQLGALQLLAFDGEQGHRRGLRHARPRQIPRQISPQASPELCPRLRG